MSVTRQSSTRGNYLDPDVAYLLGMIIGRGSITDSADDRRLVIDFPFSSLQAKGITKRYEQKTHLKAAVNDIRDRIEQLVEGDFSVHETGRNIQFVIRFRRTTMTWRNLLVITEGSRNFRESAVPERVFEAAPDIQREFVRGLVDVCGFVRDANAYYGRHRVYIEIPGDNWRLPVSICRLLQVNLKVPVQLIQWNHPNTRISRDLKQKLTRREHQVKIFADAFMPVGFYVRYKQEILEELAQANEAHGSAPRPCNPNREAHRVVTKKLRHPEEKNKLIPACIRGKHFEAYWQICTALGCRQYREIDPAQRRLLERSMIEDAEDPQ